MLLYATQMPVAKGVSEERFVQVVIDWVQSEQVNRVYHHIWGDAHPQLDDMNWGILDGPVTWGDERLSLSIQRVRPVVAARSSIVIQVGKYVLDVIYNTEEQYITMAVHGEGKPVDKEHFLPV